MKVGVVKIVRGDGAWICYLVERVAGLVTDVFRQLEREALLVLDPISPQIRHARDWCGSRRTV